MNLGGLQTKEGQSSEPADTTLTGEVSAMAYRGPRFPITRELKTGSPLHLLRIKLSGSA